MSTIKVGDTVEDRGQFGTRSGTVLEINEARARARVYWHGDKRTWFRLSALFVRNDEGGLVRDVAGKINELIAGHRISEEKAATQLALSASLTIETLATARQLAAAQRAAAKQAANVPALS